MTSENVNSNSDDHHEAQDEQLQPGWYVVYNGGPDEVFVMQYPADEKSMFHELSDLVAGPFDTDEEAEHAKRALVAERRPLTDEERNLQDGLLQAVAESLAAVEWTPRDPKRIDQITNRLRSFWRMCPDWRLGQILVNALSSPGGPWEGIRGEQTAPLFYLEDDVLLKALNQLLEEHIRHQQWHEVHDD